MCRCQNGGRQVSARHSHVPGLTGNFASRTRPQTGLQRGPEGPGSPVTPAGLVCAVSRGGMFGAELKDGAVHADDRSTVWGPIEFCAR